LFLEVSKTMRSGKTGLTGLALTLLFALMAYCPARAQETASAPQAPQDDSSRRLHYADESTPENNFVFDLNELTAYDDNAFGDNAHRVGSSIVEGGAHFGFDVNHERSSLSLDYQPEGIFYFNVPGYNQANHNLSFNAKFELTHHFQLRFQDTGFYYTGISSPSLNSYASPQLSLSPSLNQTTLFPLARIFSDEGRVDAIYQSSRRSQFDFYGTAGNRNFSGVANPDENLFNTQIYRGGFDYTYRTSAASTWGLSALHQTLRFGTSLDDIETPALTYAWQGKSGVSFSMEGGPDYVRLNDFLYFPGVAGSAPAFVGIRGRDWKWEAGGGASIGWRSARTRLVITGQRAVSDGGGFLTAVMNNAGGFNLRQSLSRHWDFLLEGVAAYATSLSPLFPGAALADQTGSGKFERQINSHLVVQLGYTAARQRTFGSIPFLVDMNRNYVSLGLFYRVGQFPLGRR
jgi:hypothetical protein